MIGKLIFTNNFYPNGLKYKMSKNEMVEYIAYIVDKDIAPPDLIKIFKDKNIFIDKAFYKSYAQLRQSYDQIKLIYNDPVKLNQFISMIKKYATTGKIETFGSFTIHQYTFMNFYSLFTELVNGDYDTLKRIKSIQRSLKDLTLDTIPTISKYDYYFEGDLITTLQTADDNDITDYTVLPSGKLIYATTQENIAIIFDLHGNIVFEIKYNPADRASFFLTSDGQDRFVISSDFQKVLKIYDPVKKELISEIPTQDTIVRIDTTQKDGAALIICSFYNGNIVIWNSETEEVEYTFKYSENDNYTIRVIANIRVHKQLIIVQFVSNMIKVYNLSNPRKILTYNPSVTNLRSVKTFLRYFPDEVIMFLKEDDIMLWDLKTNKTSKLGEGKSILMLPNNEFIVSGFENIDLYSAHRLHKLKFDMNVHDYPYIDNMALLPDNTLAISGMYLSIFNIDTGKLIRTIDILGSVTVLGNQISFFHSGKIDIYK